MKERLTEIIRLQKLAGIKKITEQEETEKTSVSPDISSASSVFDLKAIKNQAKEKSEKLNEALGTLAIIGMILAIPAFLQGFATLIEKGKRKFSGLSKEDIEKIKAHNIAVAKGEISGHKKYASKISKDVDSVAHWMHEQFVTPIQGVLHVLSKIPIIGKWKWLKEEKLRHKLAEALYLVAALAIGGWGLFSHAIGFTSAIDAGKLADVAVDSAALANSSGLVKDGPEILLKLVA